MPADIIVNLDLSGIREAIEDLQEFEEEAKKKAGDLAAQAHLFIKEEVQRGLHSRRDMYDEALSRPAEISEGVWVITLDKKAVWIEEGMGQHSLVDDLLKQNYRTASDGSRYKAIPFGPAGKGPARATQSGRLMMQALKTEMKKRNISYKAIERHPDGAPKTGLLHKFNVSGPQRPPGTEGKPGWGKGAVGAVMQGPGPSGGRGGGTPFLTGVRVYQTAMWKTDAQGNRMPDPDKMGRQRAVRGILTFRTVSTKHKGIKWEYPGIEGTNFFEKAELWIRQQWDTVIVPELVRKFGVSN